jgi:plastocyanin
MRLATVLVMVALVSACGGGDDGGGTDPTPVPASVSISPAAPDSLLSGGATVDLNATVRDENDDVIPSAVVTWSTNNATAANVNAASGLVTAGAIGNTKQAATITATVNGHPTVTSSVTIGVRQKLASIDVTPDAATLDAAATRQLTTTARDARGVAIAGMAGVTYGSANDAVATVSGTGLVTAVTPGTVKIGATLIADGGTRTDSTTITVSGPQSTANVTTTGFSFVPENVSITRAAGTGTVNWALGATHSIVWDGTAPAGGDEPICPAGTCNVTRNFTVAGTYNYHCSVHGATGSGMHGSVTVQ